MIRVEAGDMLQVIPRLVAEGVVCDAVVTDPPYGLEFMGKDWDSANGFRRSLNAADVGRDDVFGRASRTSPEYRTGWQSGGGFSKPGIGERQTAWPSFSATSPFGAANPTCANCGGRARGKKKCFCVKPAWKPIGKRRNPENEGLPDDTTGSGARGHLNIYQRWTEAWAREVYKILRPGGYILAFGGTRTHHRMVCGLEDAGFVIQDTLMFLYGTGFPKSRTHLKPAFEPICLAYKPGGKRTMQVDECRVGIGTIRTKAKDHSASPAMMLGDGGFRGCPESEHVGRWPANICHGGSDEVLAAFPDAPGQLVEISRTAPSARTKNVYGTMQRNGEATQDRRYTENGSTDFAALPGARRCDSGSAARFFYSAKADAHDRWGSRHPTVKPVDLIRWLVALVTPLGGLVIDPFAGSGTTGAAAMACGRDAILIEREPQYVADIEARLAHYRGEGPHSAVAKARSRRPEQDTGLFAGR